MVIEEKQSTPGYKRRNKSGVLNLGIPTQKSRRASVACPSSLRQSIRLGATEGGARDGFMDAVHRVDGPLPQEEN